MAWHGMGWDGHGGDRALSDNWISRGVAVDQLTTDRPTVMMTDTPA